ncbi:MAG: ComF family protein [Erysipelotrichaceae bacterium]
MYIYNKKDEPQCLICNELITYQASIEQFLFPNNLICGNCIKLLGNVNKDYNILGINIHALYLYTPFMETTLFQYKECHDTALAAIFLKPYIKEIIDKYRSYTIVYMPSSKSKTKERGFFALDRMFKEIGMAKVEPFRKNRNYKQSLQNEKNRNKIEHIIELDEHIILPDTPLLLVDDVVTSGNSIRWAKHLLDGHKYNIAVLCIAIHPGLVEKCRINIIEK